MECIKCNTNKAVTEFYKDKSRKTGYSPICKVCDLTRRHAYYEKNKDQCIAEGRIWREKNKEKYIGYRTNQKANEVNCECGGHYTGITRSKHFKSKRHIEFTNTNRQLTSL